MSEFGREIGLVHQIIMDSKRLGADERFWKSLVKNEEFLASVIDVAAFYHPQRIGFRLAAGGGAKDFSRGFSFSIRTYLYLMRPHQIEVEGCSLYDSPTYIDAISYYPEQYRCTHIWVQ
ncbi:MAG TPA: hypothetical protein VJH94_04600 [Candidatus Paceibacterota bacterium]